MQAINAKILFAETAEHAGTVAFLMNCCLCCIGAGWNRRNLRDKLSIEGSFLFDCMLELFCCCCAVNQEWRETFARRFNDPNRPIWRATTSLN
jgi:Cys-rich protein (TIGR01571 family)